MSARPAVVLLLCAASLTGCKKKDDAPSTEALELIPAEIQGVYGRTPEDAPGMTVSATGLARDQMKLTIHAGKMEGSTVRVERATLAWEKLDPKTCHGTISRQGDRLLMTLYDSENEQAKCESTLDAEWFHWPELDALPELIQGRYGSLLVEPRGMHLDVDWIHAEMKAEAIRELPGNNDERAELLIAAAKVTSEDAEGETREFACAGTMTLEDGRLTTDFWVPHRLVPEAGSEAAKDPARQAELAANEQACDAWDGGATKWTVDLSQLPKQTIAAGELSLAVSAEQVVLDSPHLRCVQPLWRTQSVDSRGGWGAQFGGERMTLARAEPERVSEDCKLKLRIWCEVQDGVPTTEIDPDAPPSEDIAACMDLTQHELCPDSITVRAISDVRYKVHVEPASFNAIACVDPTGEFSAQP
jgi:hypothetical protein